VLAADACAAAGLEVPPLTAETRARLGPGAAVANPVDLAADAQPEAFRLAIEAVLADEGIDAVIAIYTSPLAAPMAEVAGAIAEAQADAAKPVLACALGERGLVGTPPGRRTIPSFAFPEAAARALGLVARYAAWLRRPAGSAPALADIDIDAARAVVDHAVDEDLDGRWLSEKEAAAMLEAYGLVTSNRGEQPGTGPSLALEVSQDPLFGPLVTLVVKDRASGRVERLVARAAGLTDVDVTDMVTAAGPAVTPAALEALLLRIGRLAEDVPELAELRVGPLEISDGGVAARAWRIRVAPWEPHPELALRRLRSPLA
jgi:hypothetical protein